MIVLLMFFVLRLTSMEVFAQGGVSKTGRVGCPNCTNDDSPVSQSLQKADELYAGFKPKEALAEFLKVLDSDPQNAEALSKIARVYIDFGDVIPESTPDWEAKRPKQYQIAEQYVRPGHLGPIHTHRQRGEIHRIFEQGCHSQFYGHR